MIWKIILSFTFLTLPIFASASIPAFPMALWGEVTINGSPASEGSVLRAYVDNTVLAEVVIKDGGIYGYTEPTKQKMIFDEFDGTVTFTIQSSSFNDGAETGGQTSVSHTGFVSGDTIKKDLNFTIAVSSNSGGQNSSGGGGGGGGGKKKTQATEVPKAPLVIAETVAPIEPVTLTGVELKVELEKQLQSLLTQLLVILQARLAELLAR